VDLKEQAQRLKERLEEHEQTIEDRKTKRVNQSFKERLLIGMTAISFVCTIGFVIVGSLTGKAFAYGNGPTFFAAGAVVV